jgi:hypothetical protein
MIMNSPPLIEYALINGKLGDRPVIELTEIELQRFLNEHVACGASRSKLSKLLLYLRNILDHAVMKKITAANVARNPGYRLRAKSRKMIIQRYLKIEECQCLLAAVVGGPHLLIFPHEAELISPKMRNQFEQVLNRSLMRGNG